MSVLNTETGELVNVSYGEVRASVETTKTHLEQAAEQVVWQIENQAWLVLGHKSWDEMRDAEYKGAAVMVPRADRPEIMVRLRANGLSQKQIGDTLGVSDTTVRRDLNQQMSVETPPTITNSRGQSRPTSYTTKPAPRVPNSGHQDSGSDDNTTDSVGIRPPRSAEPSSVPAPSEPEPASPDPLGDYLDGSQAVQDARYLASFYKAIVKESEYRRFDAERIGRIGDDADMRTLELAAKYAAEFFEKAKRARSGLRVITGGKA